MSTRSPLDSQAACAGSGDATRRNSERGSALLLALILILVLTFMGFGLLTRSLLVSEIAGAERWSTKAFFAADAGINVAKARLRIRQTQPFTFSVQDNRGFRGGQADLIQVAVSDFNTVGPPQMLPGTQTSGGQGASTEPLYSINYRGTSVAQASLTHAEAQVSTTQSLSPVPLTITGP